MATTTSSAAQPATAASVDEQLKALALADTAAAKPDPTADDDLHVPISTAGDITGECPKAKAAKAAAAAKAADANATACAAKPVCAVAQAIAAAPAKVMAAIKAVVANATGGTGGAAKETAAPCGSLTAMSSSEPPIIIQPVLTPPASAAAAADGKTAAAAATTGGSGTAAAAAAVAGAAAPNSEKKLSLQELVHSISQELNSPQKCMKRVRSLMERYDASGGEWRRYAFWDAATNYTRNLIATDQRSFTLMQLCWNPGKWSPCHDHNGSECFMRMVEGQLVEVRYRWPDPATTDLSTPLQVVGQTTLPPGAVCFINDALGLHKVGNPSATVPAVSLHCYIPGYDTCRAWCQPDKSGRCVEANISYYSELGKKACH